MFLHLSWRNIWRNPRRTMVIMIAVVIGVWSMIFLSAFMRGITVQMVRNGISTLTGHIQIHRKGYRSDPVIENSISNPDSLQNMLEKRLPEGAEWSSRVRVNGIVSNARHSEGVTLVGIDPKKEARVSFLAKAISKGSYLKEDDKYAIVVGEALAEEFQTKLGRKLVLMSQNMNNEIASKAFRIVGIFNAEIKSTEKQFVFVTLPSAQEMLQLGAAISEICILLPDQEQVDEIAGDIRSNLSTTAYEVQTWKQLLPLVVGVLEMYDAFIVLWFIAVFIAMAFGIVNTTLMAVFERIREFGLFKALGMKPLAIIWQVLTESFFILVIGIIAGNFLGFLSIFVLSQRGIDLSSLAAGAEFVGMGRVIYPSLEWKDVVLANLVVFLLGLLVSTYPAAKAARFTPVEAMRHT